MQEEEGATSSYRMPHGLVGGFLGAGQFQEMLYLERKRRERSRKPLYLLLIDVTRVPEEEQDAVVMALSRHLSPLFRETDMKGWYSDREVLGVLFTEVNGFDQMKMIRKVADGLKLHLVGNHRDKLDFSIHRYPPEKNDGRERVPASTALYPEVTKKYGSHWGPFVIKRLIDIAGSITGLLLFSPIFLVSAILIKLTSPGPVLFRQERVGLYGSHFTFLKFRTMYVNNDPTVHQEYVKSLIAGNADDGSRGNGKGENGGNGARGTDGGPGKPVYKIKNDARVTRVGRILRKTSMDELPQFINVLLGEMSLVGPRPPIPYEVENYDIWHRSRIVEVKPGITGLWQVMGRSSTTFDEMVRLDIKYSREWTVWLDLKILAMTPWAVLRGKGAY